MPPKPQLRQPVGLEVQAPWAALMLWGYKTVETRQYPLPDELVGRDLWIVESAEGQAGVSLVGDAVAAGAEGLRIVGSIVFSGSPPYRDRESWEADEYRHRVPKSSAYGWKDGRTIYGWEVQSVRPLAEPVPVPAMRRLVRSIFELDLPDAGAALEPLKSRLGAQPARLDGEGSIPTIDLTPFMRKGGATPEERRRIVDAVRTQCEYIGFLRVTWDGFPVEVVEKAQDAARRLFECDEDTKQRYSKAGIVKANSSYTSTGYRSPGSTENNKNRESWSCTVPYHKPRQAANEDDYFASSAGQQHFALAPDPQVPWPAEQRVPGFRRAVLDYYAEAEKLGRVLLSIFAEVLGCDEAKLAAMTDKHVSPMNLFSFTMGEGGEVLPAHADVSVFTILAHDTSSRAAGSACLEMLTPEGVWEPVAAKPGCFVVNVGQILQRWSNGRLRATVHRVLPPTDGVPGAKRQSITFFQLLNYDAAVSVLPEAVASSSDGLAKYPPQSVADWQKDRLSGFYAPPENWDVNKCWLNYNRDAYVA